MRFLMLNWRDPHNPLSGGAERVSLGYLSALARRGHEVYWFANNYSGANRADLIEGVNIIRGGGIGISVLEARRWYRQQKKFDLVIDQHHGIPWYAPWWSRTNNISYIHEVLKPIWSSFYPWPLSLIGRLQERWTHWLYRDVQFWTACESTRDDLRRNGVRKIHIIRYGVHTRALAQLEAKPLTAPLRLVVVSRLAPNKRIDHALRTTKSLLQKGIPAQLHVIGIGECEPMLKKLAHELGLTHQARFKGALAEAEKDEELRRSHFLLHTSQREGWGLNVIEANAMGTPAAVYPVPGLIESTLHDQTGIVASSETPDALATGIAGCLTKPQRYESYRVEGWKRAQTLHWDVILPQACDWLEEQAGGSQTGLRQDRITSSAAKPLA